MNAAAPDRAPPRRIGNFQKKSPTIKEIKIKVILYNLSRMISTFSSLILIEDLP
jgi:hypothetical protein